MSLPCQKAVILFQEQKTPSRTCCEALIKKLILQDGEFSFLRAEEIRISDRPEQTAWNMATVSFGLLRPGEMAPWSSGLDNIGRTWICWSDYILNVRVTLMACLIKLLLVLLSTNKYLLVLSSAAQINWSVIDFLANSFLNFVCFFVEICYVFSNFPQSSGWFIFTVMRWDWNGFRGKN